MTPAIHAIAIAAGATTGSGCLCMVCGHSPFPRFGPPKKSLGPGFSSWEILGDGDICAGCKQVLSGRPGRTPPPLRMRSFMVTGKTLQLIDREDWMEILSTAPEAGAIYSWARTKQKHHALHADYSGDGFWVVGSDEDTLRWPHDPELLPAVLALLEAGIPKGALMSGNYGPRHLATQGALIERLEPVLARHRGLVLDLHVWAAPAAAKKPKEEHPMDALTDGDRSAVALLAEIAWGSAFRAEQGLQFWGGFFLGRIRRYSRLSIADLSSRLISDTGASVTAAAKVGEMLRDIHPDTEEALRSRPDIIHGLAFAEMAKKREAE